MARSGYSAAHVRAAEASLLAAGVPLMQRAADGLADELRRLAPRRVLLLVGTGDNGGDALFAGAALAAEGIDVAIVASGDRMHGAGLAAATSAGARVEPLENLVALAGRADVIVDGIVGTGSSGGLRESAREIVDALLGLALPAVVAVDIPSGIGTDDGSLPAPVLPADITVTFGAIKAGLLLEPARSLAGRVVLVDIGLDLSGMEPLVRA